MAETIDVIIPAYGETPHLRSVLDAICSGTLRPASVTVSHSGDHDPSGWIGAHYPDVMCCHSPQRLFAGEARNRAAALGQAEILAFCDSDTVPAPDWLQRIAARLEGEAGVFLVGSVGVARLGGYWGMSTWHCEFSEQAPFNTLRDQRGGASCNTAIRRTDFEAVGGFPNDFRAGQDTMLFYRLREAGLRQLFDPDIRVDHFNIPGFRHFARHQFNQGRHFAKTRLHADLPGRFAVRIWPLSIPLGAYKALKVLGRLARARRICWLLGYLPGILVACTIWGAGCTYAAATGRFTGRY